MLNQSIENYEGYILRYYNDSVFPYVSGLEIRAERVYSVCPGKVISVGHTSSSNHCVTVLVNNKQMVRYTNLISVDVQEGEQLTFRSPVGLADKFVRFEYCTPAQGRSVWPVRIKSLLMYKHDPLGLLTGDVKLEVVVDNIHMDNEASDTVSVVLDKHMLDEFTGSRGEE